MPFPAPEETRDDDVPAVEIEMADGKLWGLALPQPWVRPVTHRETDPFGRSRVRIELVTRVGYPPDVMRLWDSVVAASRRNVSHSGDAFVRFTVAVLRLAHEVELEEAEALVNPSRVDLVRVAKLLIPAAFGDAREIGPMGGESP